MTDIIQQYFSFVFHDFPARYLVWLLVLFSSGMTFSLVFLGVKKGLKWSARLLLFEYIALLFALAVLTRPVHLARKFDLTPFWSYRAIKDGVPYLLIQNIGNVMAFVPVGILLGFTFKRMRWWKALLIGGIFSFLIEMLQFVFKRGFAEFDDVFHNVMGCMIGYGMYYSIKLLIKRFFRFAWNDK